MDNNKNIKQDPFWEECSKLSAEEIESKFSPRVAEVLKIQKQKEEPCNKNVSQ